MSGQIEIYRQIFAKPDQVEHLFDSLSDRITKQIQLTKNPVWVLCAATMVAAGLIHKGKLLEKAVVRADRLHLFKDMLARNRVLFEEVLQMSLRRDWEANPIRQLNAILDKAGLKIVPRRRRQMRGVSNVEYMLDNSIVQWIS